MTSSAVDGAVVFTDLVGFTEYNGLVGDEAAVAVLDKQARLVEHALKGSGGRVVKELGDGLMVWFPSADDATRSVTSLLVSIDDARADGSFPLAIRAGAHLGPALARGDDLVGQTVNIAARIAALAGPSEFLVSDEFLSRCESAGATARPLGAATVKGVATPVWLHRLTTGRTEFVLRSVPGTLRNG